MDVQPPRDASLRNIIDKLAEFVARNGPEFEAITKQKQQNNPKFEFLYGGEFANYYQLRVAAEQAMLKQTAQGQVIPTQLPPTTAAALYMQQPPPNQAMQQQQPLGAAANDAQDNMPQQSQHLFPPNAAGGPTSAGGAQPPTTQPANGSAATALTLSLNSQLDAIIIQQYTLREQVKQSDANLTAQHTALMTQKSKQIDEAMATAQTIQLEQLANEQNIVLREFDNVLQPIIESCTKDSISAGKNWILQHSTDSAKINVVLQYLLKKALLQGSTFQQKLHLIYLVNDILHHCMRKNISDLKNSLENVVIPMFCSADLIASADQRQKLSKLLSLWESKAKFFDACVISKLQSPESSMQEYKTNLQNTHHDIVTKFTQNTKATLDNYQKQHQIFMQHATQQITQLEQQKQQLEQQILLAQKQLHAALPQSSAPGGQQKSIPSLMSQRIAMPGADQAKQQQQQQQQQQQGHEHLQLPPQHPQAGNNLYAGPNFHQQQQQQQQQQQPPPNHLVDPRETNFFIPDMSKPPPGFAGGPMHQQPPLPPPQYQQIPGQQGPGGPGGEAPVDLGVLNAAIQAVIQLKNQQQQQQQQQQQRHPDDKQSQAQQQLQQQQQQQLQQQQQQLQQQIQQQQQQLQQQQAAAFAAGAHNLRPGQLSVGSGGNLEPAVDFAILNAAINAVLQHPRPEDGHGHPAEHQTDAGGGAEGESGDALQPQAEPQLPTGPYYDLPAGLMVPLIRLEDYNYKSLDSADIRVPAPAPQSERLTNALNAFYAAPSHDRPRDNEGWEKLGLYEYYKVKNAARKQKEEELKNGTREKSRSPSPIILEKPKPKKGNKRSYRSKSRSRSRSHSPMKRDRSRSRSKSRSVERVVTPPPVQRSRGAGPGVGGSGGAGGSSNRKSRSQRSPRHERDNSNNSSSSSRENRSNNSNNGNNSRRIERDRSPTPPSFFGSNFAKPQEFIEATNKGHQMLMKMGWAGTGTGLGSKNQGIDTPISGGEVRDRRDMYKGVGTNLNDPFESFRKNKGAAFAHRMRTRDDKS